MNTIFLTGNLGKDPVVRYTANNVAVCNFSLGVSRPHNHDATDWIDCVAWRHNAEFVGKYAKKGDRVGAVGSMTVREYEDSNGNKRRAYEVQCEAVELFGKRKTNDTAEAKPAPETAEGFKELSDNEPLPL